MGGKVTFAKQDVARKEVCFGRDLRVIMACTLSPFFVFPLLAGEATLGWYRHGCNVESPP